MAIHKFKDFNLDIEVPASAPSFFIELIENSGWERYECEIIKKAVNSSHRVLEGGAGLGVTSALLGKQASFTLAFEANPKLAKAARKNQKINGSRAKIVNAALGASDGVAKFSMMPDWWDSQVITKKTPRSKSVEIVDAQRIIDKYDINALVLDVEGEEEKILPHIDLSKINLIIVELHVQIDKSKMIRLLEDNGLKRKNNLAKADHSVVWYERPSKKTTRLRRVLRLE